MDAIDALSHKVQAVERAIHAAPPDEDLFLELSDDSDTSSAAPDNLFDIDVDDVRRELAAVLGKSLSAVVTEEMRSTVNSMRGRID